MNQVESASSKVCVYVTDSNKIASADKILASRSLSALIASDELHVSETKCFCHCCLHIIFKKSFQMVRWKEPRKYYCQLSKELFADADESIPN